MPTVIMTKTGAIIKCRACKQHFIHVPRWTFNGDLEKPTFTPSVRETCPLPSGTTCCHYNITGGKIIYHSDCTHDLKGQTLDLEQWTAADMAHYAQPGYQE